VTGATQKNFNLLTVSIGESGTLVEFCSNWCTFVGSLYYHHITIYCFRMLINRDEDWWDNDSQLNTISMTHPRLPGEHPLSFVVNDSRMDPQPGVWYVITNHPNLNAKLVQDRSVGHVRDS
jgi:hypothetical protein